MTFLNDKLVESSFSRLINGHTLAESSFSRLTSSQISAVTCTDHNVGKLIELLDKTNNILNKIEGNTRDTENDVWYPKPNGSKTLLTRIRVANVGNIDTVNQQFYCEFYLYVKWKEPLLTGKEDNENIPWDKYWDPEIKFPNMASCDLNVRRHFFDQSDNEVPFVCLRYHIKGYFREVLEVNDFPFDYQELTISIMARWRILKDREIRFVQDDKRPDGLRTLNFLAKQEWDLQPHLVRQSGKTEIDPGMPEDVYPMYTVQMHVRRQPSHYIYNVALVMFLIAGLTFSTFIFKPNQPGERLQITLTLLLTSVAFKYVISSSLPKVSYLTLLDKYVLWCLIFHFLMAVHSTVSYLIQNEILREIFEWACFYLAISFFIILHGVFSCIAFNKWRSVLKLIKKQNEKFHPASHLENLQKVVVT